MSTVLVQRDLPLILVVDDDRSMRLLLSKVMETEGYQVVEAMNGEECIAVYKQLQPDMILLDAMMPVMDGFTCCNKLQAIFDEDSTAEMPRDSLLGDSFASRTPILMITGLDDQESVDRAFEAGATDFVTKPIHWAVLRQRVRRLLQASRAIRDMTESKRVEAEIRTALKKEKEVNELKSRFVTMTSHEFRTPLTTILSSAELLQDYGYKWTEDKKLQHLQRIQIAVKHMIGMLNDVLLIGKAEAGKLDYQPILLDLVQFCHDLVEELQLTANNHTIVFYSHEFSISAYVDDKLLRQILNNLLSNAIKYSPKGGSVQLELYCEQGEAIFHIQDEGIGIPAKDQDQLFNSFHRASNVGNISGTGLGLAIVKKSVELLTGKVLVQSEVGVGTKFTVTIPLHQQIAKDNREFVS